MFTLEIETWLQDSCTDDDFYDSHIQVFTIRRRDARRLLRKIDRIGLRWFLDNYTYDLSDQLYRAAQERGLILEEWIVKSGV